MRSLATFTDNLKAYGKLRIPVEKTSQICVFSDIFSKFKLLRNRV